MTLRQEFFKDPWRVYGRARLSASYPQEWWVEALDHDHFRANFFWDIARSVSKTGDFPDMGPDTNAMLPLMPQRHREELFRLCTEERHFPEWYEGFVAAVGPVSGALDRSIDDDWLGRYEAYEMRWHHEDDAGGPLEDTGEDDP